MTKTKSRVVQIRVNGKVKAAMHAAAKADGRTLSNWIRLVCNAATQGRKR